MDFDYPEWIKDIILEITNSPDEKLVYLDIFSGLGNSETLLGKTVYFIIYRDKPDKGIAYWEDGQIIDLSDPVRLTDFTENTIMWRKIFDIEHYIPLDRTFFTKGVSYEPQSDYPNWLQSRIDETDLPDFPYNGMSIFKGEWKQQTVYLVSYASGCSFCSLFDAAGNVINLSSDEEIRNFSAFSKNWICIFRFDVNYYFYTSDYYYAPYEPVDSLPEWVFPLLEKDLRLNITGRNAGANNRQLKPLFPKAPLAANSTSPKPFTALIFLTFGRQISQPSKNPSLPTLLSWLSL